MCKKLIIFILAICLGSIAANIVKQFNINNIETDEITNSKNFDNQATQLLKFDSFEFPNSESYSENNSSRFKVAGVDNDEEIKNFYLKFQKAVAENDRKTVSSMMIYPLRVNFPTDKGNKGYTFINNKKSFLKLYDKILAIKLKSFIAKINVEKNEDIWARHDGIAVGRGVIWIGVYCTQRYCEDNKYYLNIRTIHGNSNLMELEENDTN